MRIGFVPLGGRAERWQPYPCPKELLPFGQDPNGRPFTLADWVLDRMIAADVEQVIMPVRAEKATLVLGYFGHQLSNGASVVYVAAPGPTLLANLQACVPLLRGHEVLFGMPDTYFTPRTAFLSCLQALRPPTELVLGSFLHPAPDGLDLVIRNGQSLCAVLPKPRSPDMKGNEAWGIAVWDVAFTERLARWMSHDGPNPGHVFHAAAVDGCACCVCLTDGTYEDMAGYAIYQQTLAKIERPT